MPRRAASLAACAILLAACATRPEPLPQPIPERPATLPPHTITIRTSPPGGIVDWNGDILGLAPVEITLTPDRDRLHNFPTWPENGTMLQIFRARWPNGAAAVESFLSDAQLPSQIGIVDPTPVFTPRAAEKNRKPLPNKIP